VLRQNKDILLFVWLKKRSRFVIKFEINSSQHFILYTMLYKYIVKFTEASLKKGVIYNTRSMLFSSEFQLA